MSRLTNLSVSFISLVRLPATGKPLTLKSANGARAETIRIVKSDDERMIAFGIVYAPDQIDSHGDTADALTIRRAAYEFMREGRAKNVDREHSFSQEQAYVAESWLVKAGDPLFPDEPEGAWAVGIQITDPDTWKELKSGAIAGISLAGIARAEPGEPATQWTEKDEAGFAAWMKRLFSKSETEPSNKKEPEMDEAKVQDIVKSALKDALPAAIAEAMKSAGVAPAAPTPAATPAPAPAATPAPAAPGEAGELATLKSAMAALEDKLAIVTAKGATEIGGGHTQPEKETFL